MILTEGRASMSAEQPYQYPQSIQMEAIGNARELGGYQTTDGRHIKPGILLRSAKPLTASENDIIRLRDTYHLATIIDLRMSFEREKEPNPTIKGVREIWCPVIDENKIRANVNGEKAAAFQNAQNTFEKLKIAIKNGIVHDKMYIDFLADTQGKIGYRLFFKELLQLPTNKSLLFHCSQGKDRTGIAAMLLLSALGVPEETILKDYLLTNTFNASLIEKERLMLSSQNLSEEEIHAYLSVMDYVNEQFMQNALDYIHKEYGSPIRYITQELGISENEITQMREKFLES